MLLGARMPGPISGWRFVERDLHDIASRVRDYDADARLVREDRSGQLGLARWQQSNAFMGGGYWTVAKRMFDLDTDLPLDGEPDGRVLRIQRASDAWGRDLNDWNRRVTQAEWLRERRADLAMSEENGEHAERFVHALRKDVSARPRAFIPAGIPKAA